MAVSGTAITSISASLVHFEVLVEDASGSIAITTILEKILGHNKTVHSWRMHSYQGIGRIPRDLYRVPDPKKRLLLDQLPSILHGYGKSLEPGAAVLVVVDLDDRDCLAFKQDLLDVLHACYPRPRTIFRIAIEEVEAWLLGDRDAVKTAYSHARTSALNRYVQDSICGTWEVLADAVYRGGSARLRRAGYHETGRAKCQWAEEIAPHLDVDRNRSKSFQVFRDAVRNLATVS